MINKRFESCAAAVADIRDGAVIMIGGFGEAGSPTELIHALVDQGAKRLTIVSNNTGVGKVGLAALVGNGQVRKMICTFPRSAGSVMFPEFYRRGEIELELVPQGTLAERIRCGGAGIPAFYTPTGVGTVLAEGKEVRRFGDREYVLEYALLRGLCVVKCRRADRYGNLVYHRTARNFGPIMCTAAHCTIVQTRELVEVGGIDAEAVVTPGVYVNRIVVVAEPVVESQLVSEGRSYP